MTFYRIYDRYTEPEYQFEEEEPMEYHITWEIDVEADSPREAAEAALRIQRNPQSWATVFYVKSDDDEREQRIDLSEEEN